MTTITKAINWIIGTGILVIGVFFAAKTYYATFESNPEISVSETLRSIIASTTNSSSPKIDFYINDKKIERATVSNFKIVNQGKIPIEPSHFHQALTVRSISGEDIVSVNATFTNPESLLPEFKKINGSTWALTPLLLNPGDEINVVVIALTNQNNEQNQAFPPPKAVIWSTRIKGMKDLRVQDYELFNEIQTTFTTHQADTLINQMKIGWTITFTPLSFGVFLALTYLFSLALLFIHKHSLPRTLVELNSYAKAITIVVCSTALAEVVIFYIFGSPLKLAGATFVNLAVGFGYVALAILLFLTPQIGSPHKTNNQNRQP